MKFLKKAITNTPVRIIVRLIIIILIYFVLKVGSIYYSNFRRLRYENEYIINDSERLVAVHFDTDITNRRSKYSEIRYEKQFASGFKCYVLLDTIEYDFFTVDDADEIDLEEAFTQISKIKNKGICYNKLRTTQVSMAKPYAKKRKF